MGSFQGRFDIFECPRRTFHFYETEDMSFERGRMADLLK